MNSPDDVERGYWKENLSRVWAPIEVGLTIAGLIIALVGGRVAETKLEDFSFWSALSLALIVPAVLVFVVNPWQMWKEAQDELSEYYPPPVTVALVEPVAVKAVLPNQQVIDGHLARLRITNESKSGHRFYAQVVKVEHQEPGPEPPWWVPWRHDLARETLIPPESNEMLKVGLVEHRHRPYFYVSAKDGQPEELNAGNFADDDHVVAHVWIREARHHQVVAKVRLTMRKPEADHDLLEVAVDES